MKKKLTLDDLRNLVRSRITKGDSFRLSHAEYEERQEKIREELNSLTFQEIIDRYEIYSQDVKGEK